MFSLVELMFDVELVLFLDISSSCVTLRLYTENEPYNLLEVLAELEYGF
jgi:hypothetical protein